MHGSPPPALPHPGLCADCGGLLPPGANSGYTLGDPLGQLSAEWAREHSVLYWRTHVLETAQDRMVSGRVDSTPSPAAPQEGRAPGGTSCPGPGAPASPGTPGKERGGRGKCAELTRQGVQVEEWGCGVGRRARGLREVGLTVTVCAVLRTRTPWGLTAPVHVRLCYGVRCARPSLSLRLLEVPVINSFSLKYATEPFSAAASDTACVD